MSTLTFTGNSQARRRKTPYDIAVENGFVGSEQDYEIFCHGLTVAQVSLYKRSSTVPNDYNTDGGSTVTYTFANGEISFYPEVTPLGSENPSEEGWYENVNNTFVLTTDTSVITGKTYYSKESTDIGWHTAPYSDTGNLYVIYASANSKDTYDTILPTEWSTPAIMSEAAAQGDPGNNVCIVFIYKASATDPSSSMPSQTATFTFSSGAISGLNNSWSKDPPVGDKIWVSTAIAMSQGPTASILASAWSTPTVWKEKGAPGDPGTDVTITSTSVDYAVSNSPTTPPSSPSDWDEDIPPVPQGLYLWTRTIVTYSTSDSTITYSVSRNSEDGTNANVLDFTLSSQTYVRNLRLTGSTETIATVSLQGIYQTGTLYVKDESGTAKTFITKKNGVSVTAASSISVVDGDKITVAIPYTTDFKVCISLTSTNTIEKKVSEVDETEYDHNFGKSSVLPSSYTDSQGRTCSIISGDYFLAYGFPTLSQDDYPDGTAWVYDGSDWNELDASTANAQRIINCCTEILSSQDIQPASAALYGWFANLAVIKAVIDNLTTKNLEIGSQTIPTGKNSAFYVRISENNGNPVFIVRYSYKNNGTTVTNDVFRIDPTTGVTYMINASLTGEDSSFYSSTFKTSKASNSQITINTSSSSLVYQYVLERTKNGGFDTSMAEALRDYVVEHGTPDSSAYALEKSGYYNGVAFTRVVAMSGTGPVWGFVIDSQLALLAYTPGRNLLVESTSDTYITDVSIDKYDYFVGYELTESFISNLNLPYDFTMKIVSGTATTENGAKTFSAGSTILATPTSFILQNSSYSTILSTDSLVAPFSFSNVKLGTSKDGIATMHIVKYDSGDYDIGTEDDPFNDIWGNRVHGAVFN